MSSPNNYTLHGSPYGIGNVLGAIYQKAAPIAKSYLKDTVKKAITGHMTHQNATLAGDTVANGNIMPTVSSDVPLKRVIKRKKKSCGKKTKKSTPKKKFKPKVTKRISKTSDLPDIF